MMSLEQLLLKLGNEKLELAYQKYSCRKTIVTVSVSATNCCLFQILSALVVILVTVMTYQLQA